MQNSEKEPSLQKLRVFAAGLIGFYERMATPPAQCLLHPAVGWGGIGKMVKSWRDDPRSETNPVFNDNKLKLGVFSFNGTGSVQSLAPDAWNPTWRKCVEVARKADQAGFEAIVPYSRWRGPVIDDAAHRSGIVFDTYTWSAGLSQATTRSGVFCTSHVPTIHPVSAAKQCATIDHISEGRFALNVVAGWNQLELEMFGNPMKGHTDRYAQAGEWIDLLRRLWTSDSEINFEGQFYRLNKAISLPHPIQKPMPPIMNAGTSETGRHFAAKYSDMAFVMLLGDDPEQWRQQIASYRDLARDDYGRDIQIWTFASVVQGETQAEAERFLDYYARVHLDHKGLDAMMAALGIHAATIPPGQLEMVRARFAIGGGFPLIGTPERIVDQLQVASDVGLDGILLTWFDYVQGVDDWNRSIMPMLKHTGLRAT